MERHLILVLLLTCLWTVFFRVFLSRLTRRTAKCCVVLSFLVRRLVPEFAGRRMRRGGRQSVRRLQRAQRQFVFRPRESQRQPLRRRKKKGRCIVDSSRIHQGRIPRERHFQEPQYKQKLLTASRIHGIPRSQSVRRKCPQKKALPMQCPHAWSNVFAKGSQSNHLPKLNIKHCEAVGKRLGGI